MAAPNDYISFREAAKHALGRTSYTTVWSWARKGTTARNGKTIRMKHVREGGRLYTTLAWMDEYRLALAEADCQAETSRQAVIPKAHLRGRTVSHKTADMLLKEQGL